MRTDLIALVALLACGGAATFEPGMARPGGVFTSLPLESAQACAAACDGDGICMAWSYGADGTCELKAITPQPVADASFTSGLSARAPAFARLLAPEPAPELRAELRAEFPAEQISAAAAASDDSGLLGGPEPAAAPQAHLDHGAPSS